MKSITPQKTRKNLIISLVAILGIFLGVAAFLYYSKIGPFAPKIDNSINLDKPTDEEKKTGNDIKEKSINQSNSEKQNSGSDPSPEAQPITGSDKKSVGMEITAVNQTSSTLQVRTLIQTITDSGSCAISMKNAIGESYSANSDVQASSSTTTCKGFNIPLDKLSPGSWTITVSFSNDKIIASTNKDITVQ